MSSFSTNRHILRGQYSVVKFLPTENHKHLLQLLLWFLEKLASNGKTHENWRKAQTKLAMCKSVSVSEETQNK